MKGHNTIATSRICHDLIHLDSTNVIPLPLPLHSHWTCQHNTTAYSPTPPTMKTTQSKKASNRKRTVRKKAPGFTKRFLTEIQSTIAYGAYDSKEILGAGASASNKMLIHHGLTIKIDARLIMHCSSLLFKRKRTNVYGTLFGVKT